MTAPAPRGDPEADAVEVMSPRRAALMEHARRFRAENWPEITAEQIEVLQAVFAAAPEGAPVTHRPGLR